MSKALYRDINPSVRFLLRSPLHGLMSGNTLLLEFTGRKSGRALSTPISYRLEGNTAHCFPRDASHAGVAMGRDGTPDSDDIRRAVQDMVYLRFPLEEQSS